MGKISREQGPTVSGRDPDTGERVTLRPHSVRVTPDMTSQPARRRATTGAAARPANGRSGTETVPTSASPPPAGRAIVGGRPQYDPAEHTVAEVLAHLDDAEVDERRRVLDAEADGKRRTGILSGRVARDLAGRDDDWQPGPAASG